MSRKENKVRKFTGGTLISKQLYYINEEQCFAVIKKSEELTWNDRTGNDYFKKVPISDVVYIQAKKDYLVVHKADGSHFTVYGYLGNITRYILGTTLVRVHRSYTINTDCLALTKHKIHLVLQNGTPIYIPMKRNRLSKEKVKELLGITESGKYFFCEKEKSLVRVIDRPTKKLVTILIDDIAFIQNVDECVMIHCWSGQVVEVREVLKEVLKTLSVFHFVETKRGYLANTKYAKEITDHKLVLKKKGFQTCYAPIPVYRKQVNELISNLASIKNSVGKKLAQINLHVQEKGRIPFGSEHITPHICFNQETKILSVRKDGTRPTNEDVDSAFRSIPLDDVTYISSLGDYVEIHYKNGTSDIAKGVLTAVASSFSLFEVPFMRVHRSYIINLKIVEKDKVQKRFVFLQKDYTTDDSELVGIPLGPGFINGQQLCEFISI